MPPHYRREPPPVTILETSEDRTLDETIENDVQHIAHLANVRGDLRFNRRANTSSSSMLSGINLARIIETFTRLFSSFCLQKRMRFENHWVLNSKERSFNSIIELRKPWRHSSAKTLRSVSPKWS